MCSKHLRCVLGTHRNPQTRCSDSAQNTGHAAVDVTANSSGSAGRLIWGVPEGEAAVDNVQAKSHVYGWPALWSKWNFCDDRLESGLNPGLCSSPQIIRNCDTHSAKKQSSPGKCNEDDFGDCLLSGDNKCDDADDALGPRQVSHHRSTMEETQ